MKKIVLLVALVIGLSATPATPTTTPEMDAPKGMLIVEDYAGCATCYISLKVVDINGKKFYVNVEKGISIPKIESTVERSLEMMKD